MGKSENVHFYRLNWTECEYFIGTRYFSETMAWTTRTYPIHTVQKCFCYFVFSYYWWKSVVFISRLFVSFNFAQYCNHFGYTLGAHVMWTAKVPMSTINKNTKKKIKDKKKITLCLCVYKRERLWKDTRCAVKTSRIFDTIAQELYGFRFCATFSPEMQKNRNRNTISKSAHTHTQPIHSYLNANWKMVKQPFETLTTQTTA